MQKQSFITEAAAGRLLSVCPVFITASEAKGRRTKEQWEGDIHSEHFSAGPGPEAVRLCWKSVLSTWTASDYEDSG